MLQSPRRLIALLIVLAGVLAFTPPARAMPRNAPLFEDLRTELIRRLDEDFTGNLERAQKKQRKAVKKALKAVEKNSPRLSKDLALAKKAAKLLGKAFPDEFAGEGGLEDEVTPLIDGLDVLLLESRDALDARLAAVLGKVEDQIDRAISKSDDARIAAEAATSAADRAAALGKAAKFIEKGKAKADRGKFGNFVTAVVDGLQFEAHGINAVYSTELSLLSVRGAIVDALGNERSLGFGVADLVKKGEYALPDGGASYDMTITGQGTTDFTMVPGTGTVTVRKFDTDRPWTIGTFSFEATDGVDTVVVTGGTFGIGLLTDEDPGGPGEGETTVTCEVNTVPFASVAGGSTFITYAPPGTLLGIEADDMDPLVGPGNHLTISVENVTGTGTHTVGSGDVIGGYIDLADGPSEFLSGSVVITVFDVGAGTVEGTFSFSGMGLGGAVEITNGAFSTNELQVLE